MSWLLWLEVGTHAADVEACRKLRQERDALASKAMQQEIDLLRRFRSRICPGLAKQAEEANAGNQQFDPVGNSPLIDYASWNNCRLRAEHQLEATHVVRYRNKRGFTFYTTQGAAFAENSDQILRSMALNDCLSIFD